MGDKTLLAVRLPVKAECESGRISRRAEFFNQVLSLRVSEGLRQTRR
jgi:hypothetical protein